LTEEEQKYRDYFQTDLEVDPEDEAIESKMDESEIVSSEHYQLKNFDFQELYTRQPEEDTSSFLDKKAFKFKYRQAKDSAEVYYRRQTRTMKRQIERLEKKGFSKLTQNLSLALQDGDKVTSTILERQYLDILADESIAQYRDYFESDAEEDFTVFDNIPDAEKVAFFNVFENYTVPIGDNKGLLQIPKREWENAQGVWSNFLNTVGSYQALVLPRAKEMANIAGGLDIQALDMKELEKLGLYGDFESVEEAPRKTPVEERASPKIELKSEHAEQPKAEPAQQQKANPAQQTQQTQQTQQKSSGGFLGKGKKPK